MFTGIVETIGQVQIVRAAAESQVFAIHARGMDEAFVLGESVAVDGCCLTAERLLPEGFEASVSHETLARTTLGQRKDGDSVNLERSVRMGDRLGGHLVTGHVDATGRVSAIEPRENSWDLWVEAPESILRLCVEKGSITVDGISLTVAWLRPHAFGCAIVPHTFANTTLSARAMGDSVNLEADIIGKYVERLMSRETAGESVATPELLEKAGFLK